jgi:limonene-1,2-epoxide hydrolase
VNGGRRRFLKSGGAGVAGLAAFAASARGAAPTDAENANITLVADFCRAWSTRDMPTILSYVGDDNVYRMTETTPPARGHAGIVERLGSWVKESEQIEFSILETYAKGPMVINHRIDRFASKVRPLTWEGVGVFFIKDGKIREWSDYTIRVTRS